MKLGLTYLVAAVLFANNLFAAPKITNLEDARKDLVVPKYTAEQRETLASQAKLVLSDLFVHRDLKVTHFGAASDPLPRLEEIVKTASTAKDEELHKNLSQTFSSLHDLHTNFISPRPFSCGMVFFPLRFESVRDNNEDKVVVSRKLKVKADLVEGIEVRDQLLEYNGIPVEKALEQLKVFSGGANPDAMRMRAVQLLSFRSLMLADSLPQENKLKLKFKNAEKTYEKEIPWQSLIDSDCVEGNQDRHRSRTNKNILLESMRMGADEYQKKYNKIFGTPSLVNDEMLTALDEDLSEIFDVVALNTPAGKIGYVRLKEFSWDNKSLDVATVIDGFRRAIEVTLADTVGLVIDVRSNPGGNIVFAEKLVQFFSTRAVDPSTVRMLANPLNEQIFIKANGAENRWSKALNVAIKEKQRFTPPMSITPANEANDFGQIWYRPTVVLTDASCYSACDIFTAGMQDMGAATIIGLHKSTGAGGANVMEHKTFRSIMGSSDENPFKELAFGQNMRVAWRQCIRSGKHNGELIEDTGVVSDVVVPLKLGDIGLESKELMKQVHKAVDELKPKYTSGLEAKVGGIVVVQNGSSAKWKEKVYGADRIDVLVNNKLLVSHNINKSETSKEVDLDAGPLKTEWFDEPVVLAGFSGNKQVFRSVRELKWRGEYLPVPADGLKLNFDDGKMSELKTVLLKGPENSGWTIVDKKLRIGKGPEYQARTYARAFLPLLLKGKGGMLKLDVSVKAEDLQDSFRLYVVNPDTGARHNIFAGSELPALEGARVKLPDDWEKADLVFEFESDENWNLEGPILDNLEITQ